MTKAGERLLQAMSEAVAIARGEADPATYRIHVPPEIDVKAIRKSQRLSQVEFAKRYKFSLDDVRDWEQRRSSPDSAARAYLTVIAREPEAVKRALAD